MTLLAISYLLGIIVGSHQIGTEQTKMKKMEKYPTANHVSTQRLSQPVKIFMHKLFSNHIQIQYKKT